jgi:hypothetical protein
LLPSGEHGPQGNPQTVPTSFTQTESHDDMQQKPSTWQILSTHGEHMALSADPIVH